MERPMNGTDRDYGSQRPHLSVQNRAGEPASIQALGRLLDDLQFGLEVLVGVSRRLARRGLGRPADSRLAPARVRVRVARGRR
jgi:hypothetical protein